MLDGRTEWRKSSYSGSNGGSCVEVSETVPNRVLIRDSKLGEASPILAVPPAAFAATIGAIRLDDFGPGRR